MKRILLTLFFLPLFIHAQKISGTIVEAIDGGELPVAGANVLWKGTQRGVTTDGNGQFEIAQQDGDKVLVISHISYDTQEYSVTGNSFKISLIPNAQIIAVDVVKERSSTSISSITPQKVEVIGEAELGHAACCNLSESFETNGTVNVGYSDGVTGAKEIQVLGLDGAYSQILIEGLPSLKGLGLTYGLGYIPGTWMSSISVAKGAGSVLNSYESIAGQINVEYLKPKEDSSPLRMNFYANRWGKGEANFVFTRRPKNGWGSNLFFHYENQLNKVDHNNDSFMDMPLVEQVNLFNRWMYSKGNIRGQVGVKYLNESRNAGQVNFDENTDLGTQNNYGVGIYTRRVEGFAKTGIINKKKAKTSVAFKLNTFWHEQDAYYGLRDYYGEQKFLYGSAIYQSIIGNSNHAYTLMGVFQYDDYYERLNSDIRTRTEIVPGIVGEYTYKHLEAHTIVLGFRADHHNTYGMIYTPRFNAKFGLSDNTDLRFSGGTGFRIANIYADNSSILVNSRDIIIDEELNPEKAVNLGVDLTQRFKLLNKDASISIDVFGTKFTNQVIVDMDRDRNAVHFYNLEGKSDAFSVQGQFNFSPIEKLDLRLVGKYDNIRATQNGVYTEIPFVKTFKGLFHAAYSWRHDIWKASFTTHFFGKSRLPNLYDKQKEIYVQEYSPAFIHINAQLTRELKKGEIYIGGENLTGYTQKNPIIGVENPFSKEFDASRIWGPIVGPNIYIGMRFKL